MQFFGKFIATAVIAAGMSAVSFAGQIPVRFKVPFAFEAGGAKLPAGEYEVVENSSQILRLTALGTKKQILLADNAGGSVANYTGDPQIVFRQYGDRYFLHQIYEGATTRIREFSGSKSEKAVRAAATDQPRLYIIAAK